MNIKKTTPKNTRQIQLTADYGSSYFIAPVFLYNHRYNTFPSTLNITCYFDVPALLNYIKTAYNIDSKDIVASHVRDKKGKLRITEGFLFLKEGIGLMITVSKSQIETEYLGSDYGDDEEDMSYFLSNRGKKEKKRVSSEHFKAEIELYYDSISISEKEVENLFDEILKFKVEPKKKSELKFLCADGPALSLKTLEIKRPVIDITLNYGPEFKKLYDYICERMVGSENKNKGLILLFGQPGTGKTNLIKLLISELSDKKQIIYMPPDMVSELSNPKFLPFLMSHQNSILVIEDGENVIKSRKGGQNQAVSNLLNIADGLLSDALNIQIICTFNCDLIDVDEALLRKGRLIAKHEFKALSKENAQILLDHLKIKFKAVKDMTLADIYNCKDEDFEEKKTIVGFNMQS